MEEMINRLSAHPMFAVLMLVLLGATLFFILRRVIWLALTFALALAGVVGYFAYTGEEPPEALKEITEKAREHGETFGEKAKVVGEKVSEKIGEELKEAAKAGVQEALED